MNLKNSTRSISLVLMAVALMSVTSVNQDVFGQQDVGMSLTATAEEGGNTISITGTTTANNGAVTLQVKTPDGNNLQAIGQQTPDANGDFGETFNVSNWKQNGMYTITANQGNSSLLYNITVSVEVIDGMTSETSASDSSMVSRQSNANLATATTESTDEIRGLSITATAEEGSDTIEITGQTTKSNEDVTFTVTSPNGNIISIDQTSPDSNGDFATIISVGLPQWSQDGAYTVTAQQGNDSMYTDSVEVEVADGVVVPEFGTIAAMILAVAIISIVAISAKSRLSIVPRY
ncbi:PEFG-CTERM sorting domain-containing protein [Nitrosopumilus sp.]|nr:PEFG-CTERM sorting domain-containing protein [Nitrosopumilus sp.]